MKASTISLEQHNQEVETLKQEIKVLTEQLEWFKRQIFGKKSEKIVAKNEDNILYLFDINSLEQPVLEKEQKIAEHTRKCFKKNSTQISFPKDLPIERVELDLGKAEKTCQTTGQQLVKIGEEVTQKLAHRPGSYYIKEIVRSKYAVSNNPDSGILIADLPDTLLPRCMADESLLADILVKKFADHLPLYRQSEILSRENIHISRQLLSQWVIKSALALKPLYDAMTKQILESKNVFIDEVPIDMLKPGNGKTHEAYMWVMVGGKAADPPNRVYNFRLDRCHHNAVDLLKNYHGGVLHSDKYGAYEALACRKQFVWCPCWAHIRRKFLEGEAGDPEFVKMIIRKIKYLFMFERVAWSRSEDQRLQIREQKEVPIIDEIIALVKQRFDGYVLPKSKFKEALGYVLGLIPYLKNYTQHPFARIDNNVAERAVRPLALGRKNWLFVGNEVGGETAAIILTLVQSCKAININPREYLEDVMRRIMSHNARKIEELLPNEWAKNLKN